MCYLVSQLLQVFLNPKGHIIDADDIGLVICWDLRSAYAISKFGDRHMQKVKWRKKKLQSSIELQKYRTGSIVDEAERTLTAENMSYTAVSEESLESRMKSEICSRIPEVIKNGTDDALESGEFQGMPTHGHHFHTPSLFHEIILATFAMDQKHRC